MIAGQWGVVPSLIPPRLNVARLDWMTSFPPDEFFPPHDCSAGCDQTYTEDYSIVWGFPHLVSAVDSATGAVELDDLNFRRTSFPPGELSAGRDGDYILLDLWTGLSVCARSVTGSLHFGHPHGLVCSCFCSTIISHPYLECVDVPQDRHC